MQQTPFGLGELLRDVLAVSIVLWVRRRAHPWSRVATPPTCCVEVHITEHYQVHNLASSIKLSQKMSSGVKPQALCLQVGIQTETALCRPVVSMSGLHNSPGSFIPKKEYPLQRAEVGALSWPVVPA